jgi:hypothetical protein
MVRELRSDIESELPYEASYSQFPFLAIYHEALLLATLHNIHVLYATIIFPAR